MLKPDDQFVAPPIRVLLIDDDRDNVTFVEDALERSRESRYEVEWSGDPKSANAQLAQRRFDICLLDYRLGPYDGLEYLQDLRKRGIDIPVIMFTGQTDLAVERNAARLGADDYLAKDDLSASTLARMIFFAIERRRAQAELIRMANTDWLTGAANRKSMYEYVDGAIRRAQRHARQFAVLLLDIDHFKQLNDEFGHAHGDAVLINLVKIVKRSIRDSDIVARLGGDEFVVILDDVSCASGINSSRCEIQEKLELGFTLDGKRNRIDASIGVAIWPRDGASADELLAVADASMYEHKRNRREIANPAS